MSVRIQDLTEDNVATFPNTADYIVIGDNGAGDDRMMTIANFCKAVSEQISTETEVLENKSIDCDDNPVTNINGANIKDATIPLAKLVALGNNFALISSAAGVVSVSTVTTTELTKLAGVTAGTVAASKALVVDSDKDLDELGIGTLRVNKIVRFTGAADELDDSGNSGAKTASLLLAISTVITGSVDCAVTIPAGTDGLEKIICFKTDGGGDCVITPTNLKGTGTTITLTAAGESARFVYKDSNWYWLGGDGGTRG